MAKKEKEDKTEEKDGEGEDAEAPKKKGLLLGGGLVGLIALAYIVSLVAIPKGPKKIPSFEGPFVVFPLVDGDVQVNMAKGKGKSFLVLNFNVSVDAYDQVYPETRIVEPLYQAQMTNALIRLGRQKSMKDLDDDVGVEIFTAEIREALGPLLFPLHIGNETNSNGAHEESNLRPGESHQHATMRGGFKSHSLSIDSFKMIMTLDDGPEVTFDGSETDLVVENEHGQRIYLNVSELTPEFVGEVPIGTFGKLRQIFFTKFLTQ